MTQYYHIATREWFSAIELQKKLDKGFDFKCNDCEKVIGEHVAVLAEGIYCAPCREKLLAELTRLVGGSQ